MTHSESTLADAAEPAFVGTCEACGGQLIEYVATVGGGQRSVQLRCEDCDAEVRATYEVGEENPWGVLDEVDGITDAAVKDVAWIDCDRCNGHGQIKDPFCDLRRAMNGREHPCPKCEGTGSIPRVVESDGGFDPDTCRECGRDLRVLDHAPGCPRRTVQCYGCGRYVQQRSVEKIDITGEDEYYPKFIDLCPNCASKGDDQRADDQGEEVATDGGYVSPSSDTYQPFQTKHTSLAERPNLQGFRRIAVQRQGVSDALRRISALGHNNASD